MKSFLLKLAMLWWLWIGLGITTGCVGAVRGAIRNAETWEDLKREIDAMDSAMIEGFRNE